jgi:hypothetical protein
MHWFFDKKCVDAYHSNHAPDDEHALQDDHVLGFA